MEEISFDEFMRKSGQILEKYRSNVAHLLKIRKDIDQLFFMPEEMVEYFYANKSEYYTWQTTQESIVTLVDAYLEQIVNMMDAKGSPEDFKFYLKDQRLPVMVLIEEENSEEEDLVIEEEEE